MISIIIPVYNVAPYLDQCLQSVLDQSYTDWECILVNDGSTDGSGEKCEEWSLKDTRFEVIHQKNQGVSAARNHGIEVSKGDYICFIDSDDFIDSEYLQNLFNGVNDSVDLIVSGIQDYRFNVISNKVIPNSTKTFSINKDNASSFLDLLQKFLLYGPCTKLYKTNIIKNCNISFSTTCAYGEDLMFNFNYLKHIDKISTVAVCNYYYRKETDSSLSAIFRIDEFKNDYKLWKIRKDFLTDKGIWNEDSKKILYRLLWGQINFALFPSQKSKHFNYKYFKQVLAIPEIEEMYKFKDSFPCSDWIKYGIKKHWAWLFYLSYKIR